LGGKEELKSIGKSSLWPRDIKETHPTLLGRKNVQMFTEIAEDYSRSSLLNPKREYLLERRAREWKVKWDDKPLQKRILLPRESRFLKKKQNRKRKRGGGPEK